MASFLRASLLSRCSAPTAATAQRMQSEDANSSREPLLGMVSGVGPVEGVDGGGQARGPSEGSSTGAAHSGEVAANLGQYVAAENGYPAPSTAQAEAGGPVDLDEVLSLPAVVPSPKPPAGRASPLPLLPCGFGQLGAGSTQSSLLGGSRAARRALLSVPG